MNNIPFARFLKHTLKNCQRIRTEREIEEPKLLIGSYSREERMNRLCENQTYYSETQRIIRKYLYDRLSPYGIIGCEYHIRYLLRHAKIVKRLGKAAKKQGKVLFLKTAFSMWWSSPNPFDWRTVPFNEFNMDEYERIKNNPEIRIDYRADPF